MNTTHAVRLAHVELAHHGFGGVPVVLSRARSWAGIARYFPNGSPRELGLSEPFVQVNNEQIVLDVIRHEIAHFIAGPDAGHSWTWKAACRKVGAPTNRCQIEGVNGIKVPPAKWLGQCTGAVCPNRKPGSWKRHRLTSSVRAGRCPKCRFPIRWIEH